MSSAPYDLFRCLLFLRPGAQFGTTGNDYALTEWQDARPMPTDAECAAAWVTIQQQDAAAASAAQTASTNKATIQQKALAALTANDTFLAIASPTNAQVSAQVNKLTRECSGLIRLLLDKLDTTAGT